MNYVRLQRLLNIVENKLGNIDFEDKDKTLGLLKSCLAEFEDPFVKDVEEWYEQKESPQDNLEDQADEVEEELGEPEKPSPDSSNLESLDEDVLEYERNSESIKPEDESLQEQLEDRADEEKIKQDANDAEDLEEQAEDLEEQAEKLEEQSEDDVVESSLRSIAKVAQAKGLSVATEMTAIADNIDLVDVLNDLLLQEYIQRDLYEHYHYLLLGTEGLLLQEHLREHLDQEMEHVLTLQRYIVAQGGEPVRKRVEVPRIKENSLRGILQLDLSLEKQAVHQYTEAIKLVELLSDDTALRVDLENILVQEQEHVHDIQRWLQNYPAPQISAKSRALASFLNRRA